jgi:hypothetical protein
MISGEFLPLIQLCIGGGGADGGGSAVGLGGENVDDMPVFCLQFSSLYFPNFSLFSSSSSMTAVYSFPIVTLGYCVQHASRRTRRRRRRCCCCC